MFDFGTYLLGSIAAVLFPIFASYKALKTSDPAQLTPWLMYWVVFGCFQVVESWFGWFLSWIPLYGYIRLMFLLYLVLPQTQGARFLYEAHVHPFLSENEGEIELFISGTHDRFKSAGLAYLKQAIELVKVNVFGMAPSEPEPEQPPASAAPQSYTQSLLARFSVPAARWSAGADPSSNAGADFFSLLAGAVSAATSAAGAGASSSKDPARGAESPATTGGGLSGLIPPNLVAAHEKIGFIAEQRERLRAMVGALDREALAIQMDKSVADENAEKYPRAGSWTLDGGSGIGGSGSLHSRRASDAIMNEDEEPTQRPSSSGFGFGDWNRNKSESDFENVDAESGAEDETGGVRRRATGQGASAAGSGGSWMPWGWGGATPTQQHGENQGGMSSGRDSGR